jgi:hypothetical protein
MSELDLVSLAQAALDLANTAIHFDNRHNQVGACEYYDKAILHIDEVLPQLPEHSALYHDYMSLRTRYDERMETLRELTLEKSRYDMAMTNFVPSFSGAATGTSSHPGSHHTSIVPPQASSGSDKSSASSGSGSSSGAGRDRSSSAAAVMNTRSRQKRRRQSLMVS